MARKVWYSPTTWVEKITKVGPTNLNKVETGVSNAHARIDGLSYNVADYGALGDGTTDDTAAIAAAAVDAVSNNGVLHFPPNHTWLISSTVAITGTCVVEGNFTTIKKKSTHAGNAVTVTGANVCMRRLTVDGNRSGGATGQGISWQASGGLMEDVTSSHNTSHGVITESSASAFLTCRRVTCSDNNNGAGAGCGFAASLGVLRTYDCEADSNADAGYYFTSTAADGCHLGGRSSLNLTYGAHIACNNGTSNYFRSNDDATDGLLLESFSTVAAAQASGWDFDYVEVVDSGKTANNINGRGVRILGGYRNRFGTVQVVRSQSYGLALDRNATNPSVGSYANTFGAVHVDREGALYLNDSGIHLGGDSSYNHIGTARVRYANFGLIIGEDTVPVPAPSNPMTINIHNSVGVLYTEHCAYGAIIINVGCNNSIGRLVSRNCYTTDTSLAGGLVSFFPNRSTAIGSPAKDASWVVGNVVQAVDHYTDTGTTKPTYILHTDALANGNIVGSVVDRGHFISGEVSDPNLFSNMLALPERLLPYSASIATDLSLGHSVFRVTPTNGTAFTLTAPTTTPRKGQQITYIIANASGGAMGAITWTGFSLAGAFTNPGNGHLRLITFTYDNNLGSWVEVSRTAADI